MSITILIIIATVIVSVMAFSNQRLMDALIFYPPAISQKNEWYRFITCGFIHADIMHLAFNMLSLYVIGKYVEQAFGQIFFEKGTILYLFVYITSMAACLLPTYMKQRDNYYYRSLGASGAVSAIVFMFVMLYPSYGLMIFPIPLPIPGFVFGPLYLIVTTMLDKRNRDHINHSAHFWGAVYGVAFLFVACYAFSSFDLIAHFISEVKAYLKWN